MQKKEKQSKKVFKKSFIIIFILLAITLIGVYRYYNTQSAEADVLQEYTSRIGDIKITFYGDGEADLPITNVDFVINGEVKDILVEEGEEVSIGDLLAKLDATEYEKELQLKDLSYQQSQLNYEIATGDDLLELKQDMDQAYRDYESAKTDYELQIKELDKNISDLEYDLATLDSEYSLMLKTESQYSTVEMEDKKKLLDDTKLELDETTTNYDYYVTQYENTLLEAETTYESLKKSYDQLLSGESPDLKMKEIDLINAEIALNEAQEDVAHTELTSPVDGKVLYISKDLGEEIIISGFKTDEAEAGTDHFIVLQNAENPTINTVISEIDLVNIYLDQVVDVTFESIEDVIFKAKVQSMSSLPNIDNNGIVSFDVTVELTDSEAMDSYSELIKNGMSCSLDFILKSVEQVIQIPVDAVYVEDGIQYVDVKGESGTEKKQIKTGLTDGKYVEVTEGLDVKEVVLY
ncbi:efflux RND transporter periplasmic adaptor subunit [Vallitalea okinawensis]|uniref:efflux RND transporter periplasmic adaptor subunit n=1 Tax=Vallitalea okinawensis TaxID=2078660 RepID=UPI000CFCC0B6|nr:biotin/lipoyl-binding protein [Vallitalea okinawensis]